MPGPQKKFAGKLDTIEVTTRADRRPMVIGTAGHVDHGKSSLVLALTGTDPDRLAEEKARAMTIDLGFAGFDLPSGRWASIIDVPGHEHFIKNMLAGIGGIDLAMLVVAADEGPMPQTVEHLAIIDLLGIERGVVAVTKSDLADEELIGYVIEEIGELLAGSTLAKAPVIPVSSSSRYGLDRLVRAIDEIAGSEGSARFSGAPRLPVDRVFSKSGHGTVVTGTLIGNGVFRIGDELVIMPEERAGRIRGLQSHGKSLREAGPGMRVAVNLTGVDVQGVRRGSVLTISGGVDATHRIDAHIQLLPDAPAQVKQNARVDLFTGASEVQARVTLLESDALEPGKSQFVQLRLANAIAVTAGDRLIVRQASPSRTIGGGAIIDSRPVRHRRFDPKTLDALRLRAAGNPRELALSALTSSPLPESALIAQVDAIAGEGTTRSAIDSLLASGEIERIDAESTGPGTLLFECAALRDLESRLLARLDAFHRQFPLRAGMPLEELRTALAIKSRAFEALIVRLARNEVIALAGPVARLEGFAVGLDSEAQSRAEAFLAALRESPTEPPSPAAYGVDKELLEALDHLGHVVRVSDSIVYDTATHEALVDQARDFLLEHGQMSMAEFRDLVGTTRKYAQALLEDFDRRRLTRRVGDVRHLGPAARSVDQKRTETIK